MLKTWDIMRPLFESAHRTNKEIPMNKTILACALALALPFAAHAADTNDGNWHGSGEAGLALASGNAKSQNLNAKLTLKKEDDLWKYDFFLEAQRSKANVKTYYVIPPATAGGAYTIGTGSSYDLTANRYNAGASAGYKFDDRSYIVGALRYEHDAFSPYTYQYTASIGYGYQVLKNAADELSFEVGPGYKVIQPIAPTFVDNSVNPPLITKGPKPDSESGVVLRGLVNYKHNFNDSTSLVNTLLVEGNGDNTYLQNDLGLQVKMSDRLALKAGYQVRHNTDVTVGKKTDQLLTTNLVYGF